MQYYILGSNICVSASQPDIDTMLNIPNIVGNTGMVFPVCIETYGLGYALWLSDVMSGYALTHNW